MIQLYTNEKKLIEKATTGDRKAQKYLYEKHAPRMLSICRQYISPVEVAEELMLNGFFKVFTKIDTFSHQGSFEGWVRRIMVRECIDYLRKKDPFKYTETIEEEKSPAVEEEEEDSIIAMDELQELIDGLPSGYKTVFIMYAVDGFKHGEIAQTLNISENTSKTQFRKARLMLQEELKTKKKQRYEA